MAGHDLFSERDILFGIDVAQPTSQHRDGSSIGGKGGLVSRGVDAPCQPAVDGEARIGQLVAEFLCRLRGVVAGSARADNADAGFPIPLLDLTQNIKDNRRIVDFPEEVGIFRVTLGENTRTRLLDKGQFGIKIRVLLPRGDHGRDLRADALHGTKRGTRCLEDRHRRSEALR